MFPESGEQLCWVHKTANGLNKLPKTLYGKCKAALHEMYEAENKKEALKSLNHFVGLYQDKYPKATDYLFRDKDRLFAFYDFPAIH